MTNNYDFLFSQKALELNLIDQKRLQNCYLIQKQSMQQGKPITIAQIVLKLRFLNEQQVNVVHAMIKHDHTKKNNPTVQYNHEATAIDPDNEETLNYVYQYSHEGTVEEAIQEDTISYDNQFHQEGTAVDQTVQEDTISYDNQFPQQGIVIDETIQEDTMSYSGPLYPSSIVVDETIQEDTISYDNQFHQEGTAVDEYEDTVHYVQERTPNNFIVANYNHEEDETLAGTQAFSLEENHTVIEPPSPKNQQAFSLEENHTVIEPPSPKNQQAFSLEENHTVIEPPSPKNQQAFSLEENHTVIEPPSPKNQQAFSLEESHTVIEPTQRKKSVFADENTIIEPGLKRTNDHSQHKTNHSMQSRALKPQNNAQKETCGRYVLGRLLGRGGMGRVYLAYDPHLDRQVAVKIMQAEGGDSSFTKRFLLEARSIAKLSHPHIVSIHDIGYDKQQFFFVMDYIEGGTLKEIDPSLSIDERITIMIKIIDAVSYAHGENMIHRDLKPVNIMLTKTKEPKVMDFGLVKLLQDNPSISQTGTILGTLQYIPPEQATETNKVDERSDIYSLGAIFYQLLTGHAPFTTVTKMQLLDEILHKMPQAPHEKNVEVPSSLSLFCLKALQKKPENRYQTAQDFRNALQEFQLTMKTSDLQATRLFTASTAQPNMLAGLEPGDIFGSYLVEKKLGQGGMGVVYQVRDQQLDRSVALKLITGDSEKLIKRFLLEARSTASLKHPNIVEVYEIGETPQNYFTMELIEGRSLHSLLRSKNLTARQAAIIIAKCSKALAYAHEHGIIHRDVKPSNIMMDHNKEPKIMDFGLAKDVQNDNHISKSGDIVGTPVYMPPEQADGGSTDARSDIYSLGATLYETLTKRPPFQGENTMRLLHQIFYEDPVEIRLLNRDIAQDLEAICMKCLQKKPHKRYQTAKELARDLTNFLQNRPVSAQPITTWVRMKKAITRNKLLTALVCSIFIGLTGTIAMLSYNIQISQQAAKKEKAAAEKAEKARKAAVKAQKVEEKAKLAAVNAQKVEEQARLAAEKAQKIEKEATEKAIKAQQETQELLYKSNLLLADQFNNNKQTRDVNFVLDQIATQRPDAYSNWEYRWQKYRGHNEKKHFISQIEQDVLDFDISDNGYIVAITKRELKLYHLQDKDYYRVLTKGEWKCCSISNDGRKIAAAVGETVHIWDRKTGRRVSKFLGVEEPSTYQEETKNVYDEYGQKLTYAKQSKIITDVCFNKGYQLIVVKRTVVGSLNKDLFHIAFVIDAQKNTISQKLTIPKKYRKRYFNNLLCCNVSRDGKEIIAADQNGEVYRWNMTSQTTTVYPRTRDKKASLLEFKNCVIHPSKKMIVACGEQQLIVINTQTKKRKFITLQDKATSCDISSDGKTLVVGGINGGLYLWNIKGYKLNYLGILTGQEQISHCMFYKKNICSGGKRKSGIKIYAPKISINPKTTKMKFISKFTAIHPSKPLVAVAPFRQAGVSLYNLNTANKFTYEKRDTLVGHVRGVTHGVFNKEGILFTSCYGGQIIAWDIEKFNKIGAVTPPTTNKGILHFAIVNKEIVAVAIGGGNIYIINPQTKQQTTIKLQKIVREYLDTLSEEQRQKQQNSRETPSRLHYVAWDGRDTVAILGEKDWVYFMNIKTRTISNVYYLGYDPSRCILLPGNKENHYQAYFASNDNIYKHEIEEDICRLTSKFVGHQASINHIELNESRLVSAANDGTIRTWPLSKERLRYKTKTLDESAQQVYVEVESYFSIKAPGAFTHFSFDPQNNKLVACGGEPQNINTSYAFIKIWDASPPK